jgi:hypothetical protein
MIDEDEEQERIGDVVNIKCQCCGKTIPANPYRKTVNDKLMRFCDVDCYNLYLDYRTEANRPEDLQYTSPSWATAGTRKVITKILVQYAGSNIVEKLNGVGELGSVNKINDAKYSIILYANDLQEQNRIISAIKERIGTPAAVTQTIQYFSG